MEIVLLLFFLIVTLSHGFTLLFVKKRQRKPYGFRKLLWRLHFLINGSLWTLLTLMIGLVQLNQGNTNYPSWLKGVGIVVFIIGVILFGIGFHTLGINQAMGERVFFPEKRLRWVNSGIYQYLKNPIYDGFILAFVGLGLWRGIIIDFYLAGVSLLLLNVILASIENFRKTGN